MRSVLSQPTYHLPPEWAPQSGVMLTWPHENTIWADMLNEIDDVFVNAAKQIAKREKCLISCFDNTHQAHVHHLLTKNNINLANIALYLAPSDDIWVRDHGPLTVIKSDTKPLLLDFIFNGWGNKYPAENDNNLVQMLHAKQAFGKTPIQKLDLVLEGGAIEVDGKGTLLTTRRSLLAKTRNPALTEVNIRQKLQKLFGIQQILWLDHGYLAGDDTDGHIDTLARFINPSTICYVEGSDPKDEHYLALKEMEKQLRTFTDLQGNPYQLIPLPLPKACYATYDGRRLPATYANFLIINDAVLVPTYDDPEDAKALAILAHCFPDREIIGIHALPVIQWYGSLHCMTMQLPKGVLT